MTANDLLHETAHRLRWRLAPEADGATLKTDLARVPGVRSVRINHAIPCVVVQHDGGPATRAAVLLRLRGGASKQAPPQRASGSGHASASASATAPATATAPDHTPMAEVSAWAPALLAMALPVLPKSWRNGAALAVVGARVLSQPARLRADAPAVLLDAASLAALAINGQPLVVATSVLLRLLSERLSARLVRQADGLMNHLLPTEADRYTALRESTDDSSWTWWPLRDLRAGDCVRLFAGDVVPLDGCVVVGSAALAPVVASGELRTVQRGDRLAAGERLQEGTLELRAEAAAASRLARLRAQVQHAMAATEPAGGLAPDLGRLLSLPLTAATLVFGLTGDSARAAAMLQADPQQGLDLALPLGREAALYALARHGLITSGLETIARLATARTLVLQDTGVLASGRWALESVRTEAGGDAERVRQWLAALAGAPADVLAATSASVPADVLAASSFPDHVVRQWVRHGAVLRVGHHEVHLASRRRLLKVWQLATDAEAEPPATEVPVGLRRRLAVVASGRVVAWVALTSPLRPAVTRQLRELSGLGFERMALFADAAGDPDDTATPASADDLSTATPGLGGFSGIRPLESVADEPSQRADWLTDALRGGQPLVMVHTVLRDLVPPGSLSLSPIDGDAGSHGILLGDPLASLVAARRIAQRVHRRLRLQQGTAVAANAALMTAAALRWLPPIGITLLHHGHALLLLLDSLRIESLAGTPAVAEPDIPRRNFP